MSPGQDGSARGRDSGPLRFPRLAAALAVVFVAALVAHALWWQQRAVVHSVDGFTMGSTWSARFVAPANVDDLRVRAELERILAQLDGELSGYRDDSALARLNRAPVGAWVDMPPHLAHVLAFGLQLWRESGGAFDMTVQPLVRLWGFGAAEPRDVLPSAGEVTAARARLGSDRLEFSPDGRQARRNADIALDVDGVAPGYAAGVMSAWLAAQGYGDNLVEVGGEMHAAGHRPDGSGWRVGIEAPVMARGQLKRVVAVSDLALTTAGDYRDYFEVDGKRYTHIIDPRTGWPVQHDLASVTVIAPGLASADGYATAIMVLGPDAGLALADAQHLAVYLLLRAPDGSIRERYNQAFAPYLSDID